MSNPTIPRKSHMTGAVSDCYPRLPVGSAILVRGGSCATDSLPHPCCPFSSCSQRPLCCTLSLLHTGPACEYLTPLPSSCGFGLQEARLLLQGCCGRAVGVGEPELPFISPPTKVNPKNHRGPCPMSTSLRVFQERQRGCAFFP